MCKKWWKQSLLFSSNISIRRWLCFRRLLVSVILSWSTISTALSSSNRSQIRLGSNSLSRIDRCSWRQKGVKQERLGIKTGLPKEKHNLRMEIKQSLGLSFVKETFVMISRWIQYVSGINSKRFKLSFQ